MANTAMSDDQETNDYLGAVRKQYNNSINDILGLRRSFLFL